MSAAAGAQQGPVSGAAASVADAKPSMGNYWHPIAMSSEVTEQPRRFMLLGEPIVAFRDEQGVAAFKDLCIHRGTALSLGYITNGRLTCLYHGWEYDRTGACVHIPSLPEGSSIPRKARAIVYRAQEAYGLVWVALKDPVAPIPDWPDKAWNNPAFHAFLATRQTWHANAGRVVENAMDFSHFNFVHKGLTELADGPVIKPHEVEWTDYGLHYEYHDTKITREYSLYAPFTLHDRKAEANGDISLLTFIAAPLDTTTTHVYQFIARNHKTAVALQGQGREQAEADVTAAVEVVMAQDRAVVESQRPEQIPLDLKDELHLKVPDATGIAYRRLLARIAGSEPFMP
jgi:phenylpropionate dioxygenase-like ring-hydroxylating dioxygenase large terminal subunit